MERCWQLQKNLGNKMHKIWKVQWNSVLGWECADVHFSTGQWGRYECMKKMCYLLIYKKGIWFQNGLYECDNEVFLLNEIKAINDGSEASMT